MDVNVDIYKRYGTFSFLVRESSASVFVCLCLDSGSQKGSMGVFAQLEARQHLTFNVWPVTRKATNVTIT